MKLRMTIDVDMNDKAIEKVDTSNLPLNVKRYGEKITAATHLMYDIGMNVRKYKGENVFNSIFTISDVVQIAEQGGIDEKENA